MKRYFWGFYSSAGKLHPIFLAIFIFQIVLCVFLLINYYLKCHGDTIKKQQIKYVLIGIFIFDFSSFDFTPNYGISFYPFGYVTKVLFILTFAYSIVKYRLLEELFLSYIEKDIKNFLMVENETAFRNLVKILSSQIGNLINKDELSNTLNIHKNTLENYLFYLEQTYILDYVKPFYKNPRKELLKSPKVYFRDLGLRNFAINAFEDFTFRPDRGAIFENLAYLCLKGQFRDYEPIHYWRTKAGAEVDFVLTSGMRNLPCEVKATLLHEPKINKSLRSFLQVYKPKEAYFLNFSLSKEKEIEGAKIKFITPKDLFGKSLQRN